MGFFHSLGLFGLSGFVLVMAQSECPGYSATNIQQTNNGLTADIYLSGRACNAYGLDLPNLTLTVEYQTGNVNYPIDDIDTDVYCRIQDSRAYPGSK
jgi:hypothetical protein